MEDQSICETSEGYLPNLTKGPEGVLEPDRTESI
jgi:hypothetical protein